MELIVDPDDVRRMSGADTAIVSEDDLEEIIKIAKSETEKIMNCYLTPRVITEIRDGTGKNTIRTKKNPLLSVRFLESNSTSIDLDDIYVRRQSGIIELSDNAATNIFTLKTKTVIIKYISGWVEESGDQTTTSGAISAGTSVAVAVADAGAFGDEDWVQIIGTDGNEDICQITGISSNTLTVDNLNFAHASGSIVELLSVPDYLRRFITAEAAVATALKAIGGSYSFATSYQAPEYSVVKGVPYPHWEKSYNSSVKERDRLFALLKPRMSIA